MSKLTRRDFTIMTDSSSNNIDLKTTLISVDQKIELNY